MTRKPNDDQDTLCQYCGRPKRAHYSLNYSEGPYATGDVLVCPTSIFLRAEDPREFLK